jgi:hypothetical protein
VYDPVFARTHGSDSSASRTSLIPVTRSDRSAVGHGAVTWIEAGRVAKLARCIVVAVRGCCNSLGRRFGSQGLWGELSRAEFQRRRTDGIRDGIAMLDLGVRSVGRSACADGALGGVASRS